MATTIICYPVLYGHSPIICELKHLTKKERYLHLLINYISALVYYFCAGSPINYY